MSRVPQLVFGFLCRFIFEGQGLNDALGSVSQTSGYLHTFVCFMDSLAPHSMRRTCLYCVWLGWSYFSSQQFKGCFGLD